MKAVVSPIINYFLANNMCKDYTSVQGEMSTYVQLNPPLNAAYQQPIYFPSNNILDGDNATITGIELISNVALVTSPSGEANMDTATLAKYGILYLSNLKREIIAELPLASLVRENNGGKLKFTHIDSQVWQNCYVEFLTAPFTSPAIPLLFNVYYTLKEKK